jgi:hypothetical protein
MIDPRLLQDIFVVVLAVILLWVLPPIVDKWLTPEPQVNMHRGCVASAYQATRYGHDLEENLNQCKELAYE